jgi:regulator of protease activity HflC (stomatin/prohibitin superfamily)
MMKKSFLLCLLVLLSLSSCIIKWKTVESGEIGIKKRFGVVQEKLFQPGFKVFFPGTKMYLVKTQMNEFTVKHATRTLDGTLITPEVSFFIKIKEEKSADIVRDNLQYFKRKTVTPFDFFYLIESIFENAIAEAVSQTQSFEDNNVNRKKLALKIKQEIESHEIMDYFEIDKVLISSIFIDEVFREVINKEVQLNKELSNIELEIELKRKQLILDRLEAVSDSTYNSILKSTLDQYIIEFEKTKTQREIGTSPGNQTIIISD